MLTTEHGAWPYQAPWPADVEYFRHSRIHCIEEGINETDRHIISVGVFTLQRQGLPLLEEVRILAQGLGDWSQAQILPFPEDVLMEVEIEPLILVADLSVQNRARWESGLPADRDFRHDMLCHFVACGIKEGRVQAKIPPPARDQVSWAW